MFPPRDRSVKWEREYMSISVFQIIHVATSHLSVSGRNPWTKSSGTDSREYALTEGFPQPDLYETTDFFRAAAPPQLLLPCAGLDVLQGVHAEIPASVTLQLSSWNSETSHHYRERKIRRNMILTNPIQGQVRCCQIWSRRRKREENHMTGP